MIDLRPTVVPKSDQLNADDLIGQNMTIRITHVTKMASPDQPISIHYEGGDGRPYKPCLSMRRVLLKIWGPDASKFTGRRLTLFRDDRVLWAGEPVGGIRISHMSEIDKPVMMVLSAAKSKRVPYEVKPLPPEGPGQAQGKPQPPPPDVPLLERVTTYETRLRDAPNEDKLRAVHNAGTQLRAVLTLEAPERLEKLEALYAAAMRAFQTDLTTGSGDTETGFADQDAQSPDDGNQVADTDTFPGDQPAGQATTLPLGLTASTGTLEQRLKDFYGRIAGATNSTKMKSIYAAAESLRAALDAGDPESLVEMDDRYQAALAAMEEAERSASKKEGPPTDA